MNAGSSNSPRHVIVTDTASARRYSTAGSRLPYAVVMTGLPGSGKTTIAKPLAQFLGVPLLRSDRIKEAIFDSVGFGTLDWSTLLSKASIKIALDLLLDVGPCVIDVFMPRAVATDQIPPRVARIIEIHCSATWENSYSRFVQRAESGARHPGHRDIGTTFEFYKQSLEPQQVDRPFRIDGAVLTVDTNTPVNQEHIWHWASSEIAELCLDTLG